MKPDWNRFAAGLLAILLCLCSFSMPAFASGSDPALEPLPEIIEEEPTTGGMEPEGVPITPKGNATLVDDFYGDKQLITVTTKVGNYFYTELESAVHAMIQRLEYSFTFNPSLLRIPKRQQQVTGILEEAEKYIWRIKEEMRCV